jgi:hypothetical protein
VVKVQFNKRSGNDEYEEEKNKMGWQEIRSVGWRWWWRRWGWINPHLVPKIEVNVA